jgi:hypothetical protein
MCTTRTRTPGHRDWQGAGASAQLERRAGARESRPGGRNRDGSWVLRQAAGPGPGPGAGRLGQAAGGRPLTPVSYGLPVLPPARRADRNSPAVRPSLSVSPTRTPSRWQRRRRDHDRQ